ncbi:MAG: hypothetical protein PVH29_08590 [Candidatus Zixiibacteriota bacterium]|jgi:hypothetical protein
MGRRIRLWVAGFVARPSLGALSGRPDPPPEPRRERLFGRPFRCLVEHDGVLVPVTVRAGDDWDAGEAQAARRAIEGEARAIRN